MLNNINMQEENAFFSYECGENYETTESLTQFFTESLSRFVTKKMVKFFKAK